MDDVIVTAAIAEARDTGQPVSDLSLDRIARRAGISRSTLFRRIRSRQELEAAVREAGVDPGHRAGVRERALDAATEMIVTEGVGALTVEQVARRANCAMTSVHTQFGGRDGLLAAVFDRYAPLPIVEDLLAADHPTLEDAVRAIYGAIFDSLTADAGVIEALIAEALAKPNGVVFELARDQIVPRIVRTVGGWLTREIEAGRCADMPLSLLVPLLIFPLGTHVVARKRLIAAGVSVPDRDEVIDTMTRAFCRAISTAPS
jgi:AcrR family transcriptional regulator